MKKLFFFSSLILGLCLILLGVYNFAFRHNKNNPFVEDGTTMTVKNTIPELPTATKKNPIEVLTDDKALSPLYREDDQSVAYFSPGRQEIRSVSLDTKNTVVLMRLSGEPLHALWSPLQKQALVEMRTGASARWFLVDLSSKTETPLKDTLETPVWSSLGDRIVYKYYDPVTKERSLNSANPDGSEWQKIGDSPFKNMSAMTMPQGALFYFWNKGDAFEETSLRSVSLIGGDVKTVFSGKFGADYTFSPDGQKILISSVNQKGGSAPTLGVLLHQGSQYQNLLIPTLVSKTVWSKNSRNVYFALPGSLPPSAVLPNDYFSKPIITQDTFWKVNMETGEKSRLIEMKDIDKGYDASFLTVDALETTLLFINRANGKLYRIAL